MFALSNLFFGGSDEDGEGPTKKKPTPPHPRSALFVQKYPDIKASFNYRYMETSTFERVLSVSHKVFRLGKGEIQGERWGMVTRGDKSGWALKMFEGLMLRGAGNQTRHAFGSFPFIGPDSIKDAGEQMLLYKEGKKAKAMGLVATRLEICFERTEDQSVVAAALQSVTDFFYEHCLKGLTAEDVHRMHVAPLLLKEAVDGDDPAELMAALLQATKDGVPTDHPFRLEAEDKLQGLNICKVLNRKVIHVLKTVEVVPVCGQFMLKFGSGWASRKQQDQFQMRVNRDLQNRCYPELGEKKLEFFEKTAEVFKRARAPISDPCMFLITTYAMMKGYDSVEEDVPARIKQLFNEVLQASVMSGGSGFWLSELVECDPNVKQLLCELCGFLQDKNVLCVVDPGKADDDDEYLVKLLSDLHAFHMKENGSFLDAAVVYTAGSKNSSTKDAEQADAFVAKMVGRSLVKQMHFAWDDPTLDVVLRARCDPSQETLFYVCRAMDTKHDDSLLTFMETELNKKIWVGMQL